MQLNTLCMYYTWIPVQGGFIIYFKYLTPLPYKLCNPIYHECIICDPGGGVGSVINLSPLCMQNRYPVSYATTQYKGVPRTAYQLCSRGNIRCFNTIYMQNRYPVLYATCHQLAGGKIGPQVQYPTHYATSCENRALGLSICFKYKYPV